MPLGDSITDGHNAYPGGYRVALWQRLTADGRAVAFVGSLSNGPAELGSRQHEGHTGWRIDQLGERIDDWLQQAAPHIVLLLIGTNDINTDHAIADAPARLSRLLDRVRAAAPYCEVLVATLPPHANPTGERGVRAYNSALSGMLADRGPNFQLVDMHSALTVADLADGLHPGRSGFEKMAEVWYEALRTRLATLAPSRPPSAQQQGLGLDGEGLVERQ